MVLTLKRCKIFLKDDGSIQFLTIQNSWSSDILDVYLLQGLESLLWSISDKETNNTSFLKFNLITVPSNRCHPTTISVINEIRKNNLEKSHVINLKKDFIVTRTVNKEEIESKHRELIVLRQETEKEIKKANARVEQEMEYISLRGGRSLDLALGVQGLGSSANYNIIDEFRKKTHLKIEERDDIDKRVNIFSIAAPLAIEIEPINTPSFIDSRARVSKFTWAVTLITYNGCSDNHTSIITEGIGYRDSLLFKNVKDGEYFMCKSEFHGPNYITSEIVLPEKIRYITRSILWKVERIKAQKMLVNIEKSITEEQRFGFAGSDNIVNNFMTWLSPKKIHSCFTWAREKIKISDIDLGKSLIGFIITIPRNFMDKEESHKTKDFDERI
jgi:hypothetical protein